MNEVALDSIKWTALDKAHSRYIRCFAALAVLLFVAFVLAVAIGPKVIHPAEIAEILWRALTGQLASEADEFIILHIRFPRAVLAVLVGGALAASGAVMQGLFRNPLADPGLVGVTSGAALSTSFMIVLGGAVFGREFAAMGRFALPLAAFAGALATTMLIYSLARRGGRTVVSVLLLAGVAIGSLSGAIIGMLIYIADDQQLRTIQFWSMGSLGSASWASLALVGPLLLLCLIALPFHANRLNSLLFGEQEAHYLGVNVERLKSQLIVLVALAVGAAVSLSGGIGFVGLVVPHLVRLVIGPDHRRLIPCSILLGAVLLLIADIGARTLHPPAEIPIGILTALLGAPFFLWLLLKGGMGGERA